MHDLILMGWKEIQYNECKEVIKCPSMFKVWYTYKGLKSGRYSINEQEISDKNECSELNLININPAMFRGRILLEKEDLNLDELMMYISHYQKKEYQIIRRYDDGEHENADKVFEELLKYY